MSPRVGASGEAASEVDERGAGGTIPSFLALPLDDVLSAFAEAGPAPGGGSAAVIAVALAAALCTMAARLSLGHMADAEAVAAETQSIRDDLAPLVDEDPRRYLEVLARRAGRPPPLTPRDRDAPHRRGLVRGGRDADGASSRRVPGWRRWPPGWPRRETRTCGVTPWSPPCWPARAPKRPPPW